MGDLTRNFNRSEVACKCGCGYVVINRVHIERRQRMRDIYGKPISPTSSSRCTDHNHAVGGSRTSSHLFGVADDYPAESSRDKFEVVTAALEAGFNRIGIGKDFVHVDSDPDKSPDVIWEYSKH